MDACRDGHAAPLTAAKMHRDEGADGQLGGCILRLRMQTPRPTVRRQIEQLLALLSLSDLSPANGLPQRHIALLEALPVPRVICAE